ncbi:MAG TPA: tRNA (adenine(22)-N(1))-methyltransferase TrmK [Candidatus Nitrosotalea sp.]|nr:tRNA (adenine(22)-N(1))-methyltransferase TrmK [Candidatus Nitrosotalea sp.]
MRALVEATLTVASPRAPVADIGAGDGQVALRLHDLGLPVVATEFHPGAYARLPSQLDRRLGDGLAPLRPGEVEGAIIAGMGARNMIGILERDRDLARTLGWLVLQPQQKPDLLETWIDESGWRRTATCNVRQGSRDYRLLVLRWAA